MPSDSNNQKQPNEIHLGVNGSSEDSRPAGSYIEEQIGEYLRQAYHDTVSEPIPDELLRILDDLE